MLLDGKWSVCDCGNTYKTYMVRSNGVGINKGGHKVLADKVVAV